MAYLITTEHIRKNYGSNTVLSDVSINVKKGDIYGLIGRNGSGKTTLLRIITGMIQGFNGKVVYSESNNQKYKVATVIHDPSLFLNMTALSNMKQQSYLHGYQDADKIKTALETVGLTYDDNKMVRHYSLGMIQRLKLAVALLDNPDILILDEPVNGLDPDGITDLRKLLLRLNRDAGITMIISSHILSELEQVATCFGILHDGRIVEEFDAQKARENGNSLESLYIQYTGGGMQSC